MGGYPWLRPHGRHPGLTSYAASWLPRVRIEWHRRWSRSVRLFRGLVVSYAPPGLTGIIAVYPRLKPGAIFHPPLRGEKVNPRISTPRSALQASRLPEQAVVRFSRTGFGERGTRAERGSARHGRATRAGATGLDWWIEGGPGCRSRRGHGMPCALRSKALMFVLR